MGETEETIIPLERSHIIFYALELTIWLLLSGICMVVTGLWILYRAKHRQDTDLIRLLLEGELALMSLRQLKNATDNFAESKKIGEGGFGIVYFGELGDGEKVAIKKAKHEGSDHYKQQFLNEVRILSQVNHRHLVKLVGCCMENKTAVLVFEFISNGTLQEHLQGKIIGATRLDWTQRVKIASQVADALNYLHSATTAPILHRDVKSANILLDDDTNAKVTDFGISKLVPVEATHVSTFAIQGTFGYIDPDYMSTGHFSDKSDVYSFGVVLLELISAKPAVDNRTNSSLVNFAQPHIDSGDLQLLIDPALVETYLDPSCNGRMSILNVGRLAMKCLDMQRDKRPSMEEVRKELQDLFLELRGTQLEDLGYTHEDDDVQDRRNDHVALSI